MELVRSTAELRSRLDALARRGARLALVPTMGFLHEGHLSLMREGARRADACAVSIFVNPAQFGRGEDLERYPRDEAGDLAKCESAGVALVWAPPPSEVYPPGYQTWVEVSELSRGLCGASRPGHFRGVATVVAKLLNLFRPQVALFGEKDFQQLQVIRRLNEDLAFGVEIVGMPIVREADGLAMSSRNAYLDPHQRRRALGLSAGLRAAQRARASGVDSAAALEEAAREELVRSGVREDYIRLVDPRTLEPLEGRLAGAGRLLVAGFVEQVRLIDNAEL